MPPKRFQFSLNPLWPHYLSWACVAVAIALGLLRYGILGKLSSFYLHLCGFLRVGRYADRPDPLHCNALLTEGRWLDTKFRNWQPDGAYWQIFLLTVVTETECTRLYDVPVPGQGCLNMHEVETCSLHRRFSHSPAVFPVRSYRR